MLRDTAWKRVHRSCIVAVLMLMTCVASSALARPQGNVIHGKVRGPSGRNMSQIIVQLETGNGQQINQALTNNEGDFIFTGLTETSYIIVISTPEFNEVNEHVDFVRTVGPDDPGERRTVQITLAPKGEAANIPANRTVAAQSLPKGAREALERAVKYSRENKSAESIAALQEAVKIFPDYFDAHLLLGGEYLKAEKLNDSINEFEQARRINPKDDRVYRGFGQVLMVQKKYALASQVFAEAARLNPADPGPLMMRAGALIEYASALNPASSKEAATERETAFGMAEKSLTQAFELSGKKLATTHLQLARLYEKKGDRAKAADQLELYLKMVPDDKKADSIRAAIKTLRSPSSERKP